MLHTKEKTVSTHSRSAAERRTASTAQAPIKAGVGLHKAASGHSQRDRIWSEPIDQNKFRYVSDSVAAPARRELPVRKPTAAPNSRLARSEARLMTAAIGATMTICGVLVLYLCSYAHIASLGMREAQARVHLRQVQADNETLLAQYASLRSPEKISAAAKALNMQNIPPTVSYIDLSRASAPVEADASGVESSVLNNNHTQIKVADRGTTGEKPEPTGTF